MTASEIASSSSSDLSLSHPSTPSPPHTPGGSLSMQTLVKVNEMRQKIHRRIQSELTPCSSSEPNLARQQQEGTGSRRTSVDQAGSQGEKRDNSYWLKQMKEDSEKRKAKKEAAKAGKKDNPPIDVQPGDELSVDDRLQSTETRRIPDEESSLLAKQSKVSRFFRTCLTCCGLASE